ncbi:2-oxoglutarate and iron-dependent oxygenase domain-containing protein 2 [Trichonephila inaurata madagascariensis]|uniref:2-oxoglutarate and iron-dependent oxygenase domain-containing protein 2 n=1 Tax=Trichonephila inaurata madagascariensis TaxID=2747483 RepID=A0A8X7C9X0_9ARAC|nr:2-oxoglutarate and iron-dependent oxygenase domain-containing protein 2 [Trichonephila inaurata madagascariensis]
MPFYNCDCFITHNIYVQELNRHFKFIDTNQFFKDYGEILSKLGYHTNPEKNRLLKEITEEINRRKNLEKHSVERKKLLQQMYKPIETNVFNLQENFLDPSFINLVNAAKSLNFEKTVHLLDIISKEKQLYGFRVFTQAFCCKLIKELDHYRESSLPKGRPNSMNKYGVLLDELGFHDHFSKVLRTEYLDPLAKVLFPEWRGNELDSHKIFTVCYKTNEDLELGCHNDNGEVTLNVCLGKSFEGGDLYFGDMRTIPIAESNYISIQHKVGYGIFHRGQQLHGALPIMKGERQNLIIWLRASSVRNKLCPMCNSKPTLSPSVGYGDGFTLNDEN